MSYLHSFFHLNILKKFNVRDDWQLSPPSRVLELPSLDSENRNLEIQTNCSMAVKIHVKLNNF